MKYLKAFESFNYSHNYNKMQINSRREAEEYTFKIIDIAPNHMGGINGRLYCIEKDAVVINGSIGWLLKEADHMGCNVINRKEAEAEYKAYWDKAFKSKGLPM